jgi:trimethyllysine dioxygenase
VSLQVASAEHGLHITTEAGSTATVSWRWLRDHGEDAASYNHDTLQRRVNALGDEPKAALQHTVTDDRLELTWPESPESTWISLATIRQLVGDVQVSSVAVPWAHADEVDVLTNRSVDAVLADDDALADWMRDLAIWGFARLNGFDGTHEQAAAISARIGYVRETIFGGLWDLASDVDHHDDTAYTQTFLAPHTDGTYSHDAPGLQMFCCVERSGTGGESIIVDGMAVARDLRADHPEHFETLTQVGVPAHYIEDGVELRAKRPALILQDDGRLAQLSLNNYDRSPMLLPGDEMDRFYAAYATLQRMVDDPDRWYSVRLEAGDVLINDNWRVLHGRNAYTGARRFVGCYLNHEDFESRCRTLGITL